MLTPKQIAIRLRQIAAKLDCSSRPSRRLVAVELRKTVAAMQPGTQFQAAMHAYFHEEDDMTAVSLGSNVDKGGMPQNWMAAVQMLAALTGESFIQICNSEDAFESWDGEKNLVLEVQIGVSGPGGWMDADGLYDLTTASPAVMGVLSKIEASANRIVAGLGPSPDAPGFSHANVEIITNPQMSGLVDLGPLPANAVI